MSKIGIDYMGITYWFARSKLPRDGERMVAEMERRAWEQFWRLQNMGGPFFRNQEHCYSCGKDMLATSKHTVCRSCERLNVVDDMDAQDVHNSVHDHGWQYIDSINIFEK